MYTKWAAIWIESATEELQPTQMYVLLRSAAWSWKAQSRVNTGDRTAYQSSRSLSRSAVRHISHKCLPHWKTAGQLQFQSRICFQLQVTEPGATNLPQVAEKWGLQVHVHLYCGIYIRGFLGEQSDVSRIFSWATTSTLDVIATFGVCNFTESFQYLCYFLNIWVTVNCALSEADLIFSQIHTCYLFDNFQFVGNIVWNILSTLNVL